MRRAGVWAAVAIVVLAVEVAGVLAARPAGARLRAYVDLLAAQGILLALGGALLVAERPFLAARLLRRRVEKRTETESESGGSPRRRQYVGGWVLLLGAALFGLASLIWAIGGEPGI